VEVSKAVFGLREAERFWSIFPPEQAEEKVIAFPAA
jgi:hypothetical protein